MALGPDEWKETMEHLDRIDLVLEEEEEEEDDEQEEEEEERLQGYELYGRIVSSIFIMQYGQNYITI